jgi:hypothetical protein
MIDGEYIVILDLGPAHTMKVPVMQIGNFPVFVEFLPAQLAGVQVIYSGNNKPSRFKDV